MTIQQLLKYVVEKKASDLHLVVGSPPVVRIDGVIIPMGGEKLLTHSEVEQLVSGVMSVEQKQVLLVNKELDFSFSLGEHARFRANVYHQKGTMAGSFRFIPVDVPTIEELGLPKIIKSLATLRQGFVLVTGPTGQ